MSEETKPEVKSEATTTAAVPQEVVDKIVSELGDKLLASLKKHVNVPGLLEDVLAIGGDEIKKMVLASETKIDDLLFDLAYPPISKAIVVYITSLWEKAGAGGGASGGPVKEEIEGHSTESGAGLGAPV